MTKQLAGVALAAVMACGWVSGATAAPFTINFTIDSSVFYEQGQAPYGITTSDFPVSGSATLAYSEFNNAQLLDFSLQIGSHSFVASDIDAVYNVYSGSNTIQPSSFILQSNRGFMSGSGGFTNFALSLLHSEDTNNNEFTVGSLIDTQNNHLTCFKCVTSSLVDGTISVVPLPSTAPMLGAAILGLAALGHRRRRIKAA